MHIGIYWWVVIGSLGLIWLAKQYPSHRAIVLAYPGNLLSSLRTAMGGGGNPFIRNWKAIALMLGAIVILAGFSIIAWSPMTWGPQWRTPRLADIGPWSWHNWLPLCIVWGLLAALFAKSKTQQKLLTVVMFMLFIGIPTGLWIADKAGMNDCKITQHCSLVRGADGSTAEIALPAQTGVLVCYDWDVVHHPVLYGYITSYHGVDCGAKDAAAGKCSQQNYDHFRFAPPSKNTPLPQYWFVPEGTKAC